MEGISFSELVGQKAKLYYCNDSNRFQLGSVIFEVIEDECDGYRSMMDKVIIVTENASGNQLLASIIIRDAANGESDHWDVNGYSLVDEEDGHVWVRFGTANYDDYYPYFVFNFYPKLPVAKKQDVKDLIEKISK